MAKAGGRHLENQAHADYDAAIRLWENMDGLTLNESDAWGEIASFLIRDPDMSFVAIANEADLVGTILCGHNGRAGQIYHLTVAKEHRNKGIARTLMSASLDRLSSAGIPRCNVFVYNANDTGNTFWLNTGWIDPSTWKVMQKIVIS